MVNLIVCRVVHVVDQDVLVAPISDMGVPDHIRNGVWLRASLPMYDLVEIYFDVGDVCWKQRFA